MLQGRALRGRKCNPESNSCQTANGRTCKGFQHWWCAVRVSLREACGEAISASIQDGIMEIAAFHCIPLAMTDELVHTVL